ncbi:tol-pal system protein YbgF [Aestuariivirga sp.]|uniref:tol-pal system protein YbgF n=1 Tax=Aestuariivirga sp. TaxID=2650926 RepID=UPI00359314F6
MLKIVKSSVAVAALIGAGLFSPAMAQDAAEMAVRMQQLEEQVRQLMGQVEELSYEVKQLRSQPGQKAGALQQQQPAPVASQTQAKPTQQKRLAAASAGAPLPAETGVEVIEQQPIDSLPDANAAPAPKILGSLDNRAAQPNDGGFQGKVLVPPSQQEPGDDDFIQQGSLSTQQDPGSVGGTSDSIENVALSPESPESLYEQSNESLLRRQFGDAEAGFSNFLQKYPEHSLAGSAQYWLGETYYAQNDYKRAAQNFLRGYKKYPKSRRAPDSLLKLGISLKRLGQPEQACAAYAAVSAEYPKAVDARKRAQAEAKRAGCAS